MKVTHDSLVRQVVEQVPGATRVLRGYGIDPAKDDIDLTVAQLCAAHDLDPDDLLYDLSDDEDEDDDEDDDIAWYPEEEGEVDVLVRRR